MATPRSLLPQTAPTHQLAPAEMFKKSIKKDYSLLSNFKDGKFWDTWSRSNIATANTQDIADVLDPDYSPTFPEEIVLFHKKQKFIHSVFDKVLHKDIGKDHTREYYFDTQEI